MKTNEKRLRTSVRSVLPIGIVITALLMTGISNAAGSTPDELEAALRRGRLPEETILRILNAADELDWSAVTGRSNMDAVAHSLAYADREGRLPVSAPDAAEFSLELARRAVLLESAGFTGREVARMLVQGTRAHFGPGTPALSNASRVEAARIDRNRVHEVAREAGRRRGDTRPAGVPGGLTLPGRDDGTGEPGDSGKPDSQGDGFRP